MKLVDEEEKDKIVNRGIAHLAKATVLGKEAPLFDERDIAEVVEALLLYLNPLDRETLLTVDILLEDVPDHVVAQVKKHYYKEKTRRHDARIAELEAALQDEVHRERAQQRYGTNRRGD